jgi:ribosomal protein S18 acetylase RimI-like enzyme
MTQILIRKAQAADLHAILRLNLALFQKEWAEFDKTLNIKWTYSHRGRDYFSQRIKGRGGFVVVAINQTEIIGYLCGGLRTSASRVATKAELENMIVADGFRGRKIGEKLVKEFFKWCKARRVKNVLVTAFAENHSGINFYQKLGFTEYELILEKKLR